LGPDGIGGLGRGAPGIYDDSGGGGGDYGLFGQPEFQPLRSDYGGGDGPPADLVTKFPSYGGGAPVSNDAFRTIGQGVDVANQASQRALDMGYTPAQAQNQYQGTSPYQTGQFGADRVQAQGLQNYQMQGPRDVQGQGYNAAVMDAAQTGYNPQLQTFQMGPAERVQAQSVGTPLMSAAQSGFSSRGLQDFQMGPAERVSTESFARPGSADAYMSPYMQNVVDIQKREAARQSGIQGTQQQAQAAQAGAFGGGRDAIMRAERERNLAQQMNDIQAQGSQSAYQQAQQQFNQEQAARLQAQQANQQAGLTVGQQNLGARQATQQLGFGADLQTSLANLSSSQQANVQNQAAQLQSQGLNAQQAMQAALANQQAGLTVGQQNLASQIGTQQLGAQTGIQAALANLSSQQQANVQNQAARNQAMGMNAQQAMQAALANQAAGLTTGQQNLAANLGIQQLGAGQNMQAQLANQQYGLNAQQLAEQSRQYGASQAARDAEQRAQYGQSAQQLAEQSRQYGAGLGLQGLQTALSGAAQLGGLGTTQFGQQKDILSAQQAVGAQQQAQEQAMLSQGYEDFLNRQKYPYQQLEFMSNIMRGTPYGTTTSAYSPGASMGSQLLGAGTSLAGAALLGGWKPFKKGGAVTANKKSAGLAELALSKI
jgi:hypothetical protein